MATNWNAEIRDKEVVTSVVRTSDTEVTVTLSPSALYDIDAREIITATIPNAAVTFGTEDLTADPTFTVDALISATSGLQAQPVTLSGTVIKKFVVTGSMIASPAILNVLAERGIDVTGSLIAAPSGLSGIAQVSKISPEKDDISLTVKINEPCLNFNANILNSDLAMKVSLGDCFDININTCGFNVQDINTGELGLPTSIITSTGSLQAVDSLLGSLLTVESATSIYEGLVLSSSPIAYYRLGELSGTIAEDETGNNDADYIGPQTFNQDSLIASDLTNKSVRFNNLGYVRMPAFSTLTESSVVLNVKIHSNSTPQDLFSLQATDVNRVIYQVSNDLKLRVWLDSSELFKSTTILSLETSYHIVFTDDGVNTRMYLDSVLVGTTSASLSTIINPTNNGISAYFYGGSWSIRNDSTTDEVALFDTVLEQQEITSLYNASI